jgi:TonB family protein
MKSYLYKNYAWFVSLFFHSIIIIIVLVQTSGNKIKPEPQKLIEVGLAGNGFLNSESSPNPVDIKKEKTKNNDRKKNVTTNTLSNRKTSIKRLENEQDKFAAHDPIPNGNEQTNADGLANGNGGKGKGTGNGLPPSPENNDDNIYHVAVDQMPVPIGGLAAIESKINYPVNAKANKIEGTVYVIAFIDEFGNVQNTTVLKGIGYGCDEAAQKAVQNTKFQPGYMHGIPVKVQETINVEFRLNSN